MNSRSLAHRQRGAVLIIGLVLLLVMTLVTTAAMRGSVLQERMAGNVADFNQAFQVSEQMLRVTEDSARDKVVTGTTGNLELPTLQWVLGAMGTDCSATLMMANPGFAWTADADVGGSFAAAGIPNNSNCIPPETLARGAGAAEFFWVMGSAQGPSGQSFVQLQTIYMMR